MAPFAINEKPPIYFHFCLDGDLHKSVVNDWALWYVVYTKDLLRETFPIRSWNQEVLLSFSLVYIHHYQGHHVKGGQWAKNWRENAISGGGKVFFWFFFPSKIAVFPKTLQSVEIFFQKLKINLTIKYICTYNSVELFFQFKSNVSCHRRIVGKSSHLMQYKN